MIVVGETKEATDLSYSVWLGTVMDSLTKRHVFPSSIGLLWSHSKACWWRKASITILIPFNATPHYHYYVIMEGPVRLYFLTDLCFGQWPEIYEVSCQGL